MNIKLALLGVFVSIIPALAQPPEKLSYQAVIRNSSNQLMVNQIVGIRISILHGTADGTEVYTETLTPTTNANGLVSIEIGSGSGFNTINWANGSYFIKTETDPAGGTNYTIAGTSQILSVPYALHAKTADNISNFNALQLNGIGLPYTFGPNTDYVGTEGSFIGFGHDGVSEDFIGHKNNTFYFKDSPEGGDIADPNVVIGGKLGIGINEPVEILEVNGNIDVHNNTVKNLADPVNANDAATKAYVTLRVSRTGDTLFMGNDQFVMIPGISSANSGGSTPGTFTDSRDATVYQTVTIGNQVWMAENLKYLPSVVGPATGSETAPYYYVYGYDGSNVTDAKATANYNTYGVLYNWPAAMNQAASSTANPSGVQGVCPTGWHLPSDAEWTEFENYLIANGYNYDGTSTGNKIAKALASASGWTVSSNTGAVGNTDFPEKRNVTRFSALPGGDSSNNGASYFIGQIGNWWSSTENMSVSAWYRFIGNAENTVYVNYTSKELGFSVRCVRD